MRRLVMPLVVIAAALSLGGCYVSLHPLVTPDVRVYEPGLLGTWAAADEEKNTWTFSSAGTLTPTGYAIDIVEDGRTARFKGELARIDGLLVLDLAIDQSVKPCDYLAHDWVQMHLIPVHSFMRVGLQGDRLTLAMIDSDWLDKAIAGGKVTVAHEAMEGDSERTLLTAPTSALQALVRSQGRSGLFETDDIGEFVRRR